ncbi:ferredoxin-type protein NapF [Azospirillum agricola]|uniref:ferredoxin-type protein NapF n=1 Tax=Azospirillum agricola TaxID=1720247 RepID=UPI001AE59C20|nr:ferredoxin-type protein NapF [Azospirillum agricola]
MDGDATDLGRRGFLTGRRHPPRPIRPPWSMSEFFTSLCSRCDACVDACPEAILRPGDGGFPEADFSLGECSFCGACAEACPEPIFDRAARPWALAVGVTDRCLAARRVVCRSCQDACPESAIRFAPAPGGAAHARIDGDACTGCGACVASCPAGAVTLHAQPAPTIPSGGPHAP